MTIPASTLIRLAGLGLTTDQAEIVAAMLRDVEDATREERNAPLDARRAADRKRKREERERANLSKVDLDHVTSRDVTGRPVTSADIVAQAAPSVLPKTEVSPPSPPKGGSVPPQRKPKKPTGRLCPEDLSPLESHYLKCEQRGAPRQIADRTAEKLINWSHGNADRDIAWKADWHRALHTMLDDEIEKWRRSRPPPHPNGSPPRPSRGSGNGFFDALHDEFGSTHDTPSDPQTWNSAPAGPLLDLRADRAPDELPGRDPGRVEAQIHRLAPRAYGR